MYNVKFIIFYILFKLNLSIAAGPIHEETTVKLIIPKETTTPKDITTTVNIHEETTPKETTPKETTPKETTPKETTTKETTPKETTTKETTPKETTAIEILFSVTENKRTTDKITTKS